MTICHSDDRSEEEYRSLPATIASARAYQALTLNDMPVALQNARLALDLFTKRDRAQRGIPAGILGVAYWGSGELDTALEFLSDAMASFQGMGNIPAAISVTFGLAEIRLTQGRMAKAESIYNNSLRLV